MILKDTILTDFQNGMLNVSIRSPNNALLVFSEKHIFLHNHIKHCPVNHSDKTFMVFSKMEIIQFTDIVTFRKN